MLIKRYLYSMLLVCFTMGSAKAAVELELTQGIVGPLPIMIVAFTGETDLDDNNQISRVIADDLQNSGYFRVIPVPLDLAEDPNAVGDLGIQGAELGSWVSGTVEPTDEQTFEVNFQLIDPFGHKKILISESQQVETDDLRAFAHHISDSIYEELTGIRGVFSTRIAYVVVQRPADGSNRYILEVADADGYQPKPLFISPDPIMSPAWSPDGQEIAFVSFENQRSEIYVINIESGERRLLTDYPRINAAPAFSPNGEELSLVLSKEGTPRIYRMNLETSQLYRLTDGYAIDTEPSWAPDGDSLLFTSDRGGTPQIYRLDLITHEIERLTFEGRYNTRPAYTPDGESFVMLHQTRDGRFNIAIQPIGSDAVTVLSNNGYADSPSLAPNGKMVIYAAIEADQRVLNITSTDGQVKIRLPAREGEVQEPAWSSYLN